MDLGVLVKAMLPGHPAKCRCQACVEAYARAVMAKRARKFPAPLEAADAEVIRFLPDDPAATPTKEK